MTSPGFAIRMSSDSHCIADGSVYALRFCTQVAATLIGPDWAKPRMFAPVSIAGVLHFADTVTGTLYDANGKHHSSPFLSISGLPATVHEDDIQEVKDV